MSHDGRENGDRKLTSLACIPPRDHSCLSLDFPLCRPYSLFQSCRWHCRHPPIGRQVEVICVEVNQFVPLSFVEKRRNIREWRRDRDRDRDRQSERVREKQEGGDARVGTVQYQRERMKAIRSYEIERKYQFSHFFCAAQKKCEK